VHECRSDGGALYFALFIGLNAGGGWSGLGQGARRLFPMWKAMHHPDFQVDGSSLERRIRRNLVLSVQIKIVRECWRQRIIKEVTPPPERSLPVCEDPPFLFVPGGMRGIIAAALYQDVRSGGWPLAYRYCDRASADSGSRASCSRMSPHNEPLAVCTLIVLDASSWGVDREWRLRPAKRGVVFGVRVTTVF